MNKSNQAFKYKKDDTADKIKDVDFPFYSMSQKRLVTLMILTFGIYSSYWVYKNWKYINQALPENGKIRPFWRMVFAVFYIYSLFSVIIKVAKHKGFTKNYSAGMLAVLAIIPGYAAGVITLLDNRTIWLSIGYLVLVAVSTFPIILVQQVINFNNSKLLKSKQIAKKATTIETAFIALAIIYGAYMYLTYFVLNA